MMNFDIDREEFDEAVRECQWDWLWSVYEALRLELGNSPARPDVKECYCSVIDGRKYLCERCVGELKQALFTELKDYQGLSHDYHEMVRQKEEMQHERDGYYEELETLRQALPPASRSGGVGQGSWSVYAGKLQEELDGFHKLVDEAARTVGYTDEVNCPPWTWMQSQVERLQKELDIAQSLHARLQLEEGVCFKCRERERIMASLPQDGSRGQKNAWDELLDRISLLERRYEQALTYAGLPSSPEQAREEIEKMIK